MLRTYVMGPTSSDMPSSSPQLQSLHCNANRLKASTNPDALFTHTIAGSVSRSVSALSTYPLDCVKTRLQCTSCLSSSPGLYRDLLLGVSGSLPGTFLSAIAYFLVDSTTRTYLSSPHSILGNRDSSDPLFHIASASLATVTSAFIRVPSDVLKHRVQARVYPSVSSAARGVIQTKGPLGVYAGFSATLLRDIPEAAIQFALFAKLNNHFCGGKDKAKKAHPTKLMALGGLAGVASALTCTPLDVIKTKLQCGSARSILGAVQDAVGGGRGICGLFAGAGPRVLQTGAASAIFFTFFELSKSHLKSRSHQGSPDKLSEGSSPHDHELSSSRRVLRMPTPVHLPMAITLTPEASWSGHSFHHLLHSSTWPASSSLDNVCWDVDDEGIEGVSLSGNSDSCASTLSSSSIWDCATPLEL